MRIGIAADHGGFALKEEMIRRLHDAGHEVVDFGALQERPEDDYPDVVVPLARAVAAGGVERGVAICGSGVGACAAANKIHGVRAALVTDPFSAHQGVEDDDMNVLCLGGRVTGPALAWELIETFLGARFSGAERHRRRLAKIGALEGRGMGTPAGNPLRRLQELGQDLWLDFIRRGMLDSGELKKLIDEDGLRGVTANPAIFAKAITETHDYDEAIREIAQDGKSAEELYEALAIADIRRAADLFRPEYDRLDGAGGYVSFEVAPRLAHDTDATLAEARRLWRELNRPNVFIKIPGTREGLAAIRACIAEGINVNVTLLFGLPRYREVIAAYLAGLEARAAQKQPLRHVASVASFFLSRLDVRIDPLLDAQATEPARALRGQVAIASARLAYRMYRDLFEGDRFRRLADLGARSQRLVWASTGTKDPAYSDVKYVEPLIGPDTINTMPLDTLEAYRDHGNPAPRLAEGLGEARRVFVRLSKLGIDIDAQTERLEAEGVEKFSQPFDHLLEVLRQAVERAQPVGTHAPGGER